MCRENEIAQTLYSTGGIGCWRARRRLLAKPREKSAEDAELVGLKRKVAALERAPGRKTSALEIAGELVRDWA